MTWIALAITVIVLLAALVFSQHRRPRDVFRADPHLSGGNRLIRWVGNGLLFFAVIQLARWVWLGVEHSHWTKGGMTLIALGLTGIAALFVTSAKRGDAARDPLRAGPTDSWGYRAMGSLGNGLVFVAAIQLIAWLWSGTTDSLWTRNGIALIALGLMGAALAVATGVKRRAESAR